MTHPTLSPLRRSLALAALVGVAAAAPAAVASPGGKNSAAKRGPAADLVVRDLDVEIGDDTLGIYADVVNVGKRKAQRRSAAVIALSSDQRLDADDEIVDDLIVRRLSPNRRFELETEIDIPADEDLPSGDVYLLVCADGYGAIREKNEGNNCVSELIASEDDASEEEFEEDEFEDESGDDESGDDFPVTEEG